MAHYLTIEDLRVRHHSRTPKMFYDYADSGSYTQGTYNENESAFAGIKLRQRVARNIDHRDLSGTILGKPASLPLYLAPVGMTGMQYPDGEIHAARAAEKFGIPFTLSTMSICSIEDVAANTTKPFWYQLYVMRDRGFVSDMIARAKAAGCAALVLTLDLQILGQRHNDLRNGLSAPPKMTPQVILDLMRHPAWCLGMLGTKRRTFGNIVGHAPGVTSMSSLVEWTHSQFDPSLDWSSVEWIKSQWDGPLILKGIGDVEDAKIAVQTGADAITVSNHGGRQLDGAPASIHMLPQIAEAVGDKIEIHFDGGIRSGQDVLKALALGADVCSIGRAYIYGLGAMGEAGVTRALEIIRKEMDITMALCGETKLTDFGPHNVWGGVPRPVPLTADLERVSLEGVGAA
ncbi:alpha-hydroxy acid oxidase [Acuticoccus kandeliae]|uniref:alpha-hydroxy acid oxidase n=1 Tax=Acuticoccus kandeliae TaxID=2073160 RepID=UPI000D3E20F3|nr:alpha-hydroxy acid oxidase [Acuticoccus kandeliae]